MAETINHQNLQLTTCICTFLNWITASFNLEVADHSILGIYGTSWQEVQWVLWPQKRRLDMIENKYTDPWYRRRTTGVSFVHLNFHDMNPSTCIPCNWFVKKLSTLTVTREVKEKQVISIELEKTSRKKRTTYERGKRKCLQNMHEHTAPH